jgi:AraC-like DNA-binding protein
VTLCVNAAEEDRTFRIINASHGLADNSAQAVICTKTGRMIISTLGNVNFYDGNSFSHIDTKQDYVYRLPAYTGNCHLYFDHSHHIWLKRTHTVTCIDLLTEQVVENVDSVFRAMGCQEPVLDVFTDAGGTLWTLTADGLLNVERQQTYTVKPDRNLQDIETVDGTLYLFYGDGSVVAMNMESGAVKHESRAYEEDQTADYDRTSVLCSAVDGFYQLRGGDRGSILLFFNIRKQEWKTVMTQPYHLNNMAIHEGKLYIASAYGYWVYHPADGQTEHITSLSMDNGQTLDTDCNTLAFDRQGGMWIGTEKRGLLYAKPFTSPFITYGWDEPEALKYSQMLDRLPEIANPEPFGRHVNCKFTDSRGWTWTGLYTGVLLERPGKKPYLFTVKDGLMNEMVHSVIEDDAHDIWVGTSCGITHLFVKDNEISRVESYYSRDNVPNESFVNQRAMKLNDGTIVMQSLDHIVTFNPNHFHTDSLSRMVLLPKLIRLMVNGREMKPDMKLDGRVILDKAITRTSELTVGYNQNSLDLTFSGLNFMRPTQTYYRLRMPGYIDDWEVYSYYDRNGNGMVDENGILHLPLIGMGPGRYQLELQVSMSPEEWAQEPFIWTINVEEPWWRTKGLYALLCFVGAVLFLLNFYHYNRNQLLRMNIINNEAELLHRISSYAVRCKLLENEVLTPYSLQTDGSVQTDSAFAEIMMKVVPFVQDCKEQEVHFNMHQLAEVAGVDMTQFLEEMSLHLNDSPRLLMLNLRLSKVADMLKETDFSIETIAEQLGFKSTNYMIASFFHHYRMTPNDYRNSTAL